MKLHIVNSNSLGNSYVLTSEDGHQLCIEAGRPLKEVKKEAHLTTAKCVGCVISHSHGDHAKYAKEFIRAGIDVYSTPGVETPIDAVCMKEGDTYSLGKFRVTPLKVEHDVPCYAYLIYHPEYGSIHFFTDAFNMKQVIRGCGTYMCECNYDDEALNKAVRDGKTLASQADRIRLSHMSLAHGIGFMKQCEATKTAKQIILIHGSGRHLNPRKAVEAFQEALGVPTYYAKKGLEIELI